MRKPNSLGSQPLGSSAPSSDGNAAGSGADAEALRESDASLRQAVELAHLGICHWDYQTDLMRGNDERFLMLGLEPAQEVITVAQAMALTHPDDRPAWAGIREQLEAQGEFRADYRIVRAGDGAVRWLSEVGRVVEWHRKKPARISSVLLDVTANHEASEALRQSEGRYRSLFTNMEQGFCLLEQVATAPAEPNDYRYLVVNLAFERHSGLADVVGRTIRELVPGIEPHLMAIYDEAVASGESRRFGGYVAELDRWVEVEAVPEVQPGHLAVLFSDVSARHRAEQTLRESEARQADVLASQAQAKSLALLQESEAVAAMGSWDYDLGNQELTWSDGLYHLFGRPVGSPVELQVFLDAVVDDDRPAAARLLRTLAAGSSRFDASLRLRVGDAVKTVRFKAVPVPDVPGEAVRVLGVCLDVSDVQRLEAENLALKLDHHKELLLAILQARENERQRLGEVLHNGLGQVLYATKLRLDQLDTPALHALPALAALHQQTASLLAEAMRQNRTLAHELVPTSLIDFGLAAAVRDVCRDLSTPQLRIQCHTLGEEPALPQPVQVTLFRLAQELALNIVRHAGATEALLELETLPGGVSLRAEDNGHGFDPQTVAEGLGLRTVRNAVALLGGTVAVDSSPAFGTHIRLRIPLPLFS
ncbi:PAS domain S-box protein [Hymenobacter sp. IS2118]|uniref:PAS domain-containing sensor histidine kinase n=1 Tax=Hymenobacter sp. IS2118 TaxID=1505605 RepID=UPI0005526817|nr:PAS domain S-box protein [Hymenobacter sp. IS2118]